jgi:putative FmdB family regulatory protein
MPLYTYRCQKEECKHSVDKIVKYDDREDKHYDCPTCGAEQSMNYEQFTAGDKGSNLYFRGNFFANTGGY